MVKMSWYYQIHNIYYMNHSAIIWVRHSRVPDLIGLGGWSWMLELDAGAGCWSWMLELDAGAGCWSWMLELDAGAF